MEEDAEAHVERQAEHSEVFTALYAELRRYASSHGNEKGRLSTEAASKVDPAADFEAAAAHAPRCVAAIKDLVGLTRFGRPCDDLSAEARPAATVVRKHPRTFSRPRTSGLVLCGRLRCWTPRGRRRSTPRS